MAQPCSSSRTCRIPETPAIENMIVYDPLRPYLHTNELRWSYGGMKGRESDWQAVTGSKPASEIVQDAIAAGFSGDPRRPFRLRGQGRGDRDRASRNLTGDAGYGERRWSMGLLRPLRAARTVRTAPPLPPSAISCAPRCSPSGRSRLRAGAAVRARSPRPAPRRWRHRAGTSRCAGCGVPEALRSAATWLPDSDPSSDKRTITSGDGRPNAIDLGGRQVWHTDHRVRQPSVVRRGATHRFREGGRTPQQQRCALRRTGPERLSSSSLATA